MVATAIERATPWLPSPALARHSPGLPAIPDVGWSLFEPDGRRWADWINSQPELQAVSLGKIQKFVLRGRARAIVRQ